MSSSTGLRSSITAQSSRICLGRYDCLWLFARGDCGRPLCGSHGCTTSHSVWRKPYADDPAKAQSRRDLAADVKANGGAAALQMRAPEVHGQTPDKTREQIYAMADACASHIDAQTQLALTRSGALPALEKARMPVLSLTGSQDKSAPSAQGLAAAQAAPHGQFHCLEGLGHFALAEDPNTCAAALIQMMETQHDTV